jgi:fructose/tagatose bisphosphate aldolase
VAAGIGKINVGTELKVAWSRGLTAYFASGGYEPRLGMEASKSIIRQVVGRKIELAGSSGKA